MGIRRNRQAGQAAVDERSRVRPLFRSALMACGIALAQGWALPVSYVADVYVKGEFGEGSTLSFLVPLLLALLVAFAACGLFGRHIKNGLTAAGAGAGLIVLSCCVQMLFDLTLSYVKAVYLMILVGLMLGAGTGLLVFSWARAARRAGLSTGVVVASAALVCGFVSVSQVLGQTVELSAFLVLMAVSALLSTVCQVVVLRMADAGEGGEPAVRPARGPALAAGGSFALCAFALATMIVMFLSGTFASAAPFSWVFGFVGLAIGAVLFRAARGGAWKERPATFAYRCSVVLMLVAFFPIGWGTEASLVFAVCVSTAALWCYLVCALLVLRELSQVEGASVASTFCLGFACLCIGVGAGIAVGLHIDVLLSVSDYAAQALSIASIVLAYVATNVLFPREGVPIEVLAAAASAAEPAGQIADEGRASAAPAASAVEESSRPLDVFDLEEAQVDRQVAAVAQEFGLTERECEVLQILAQGYGLARVQELLVVSEGTATTHRRHIYKKLGVHSREELIDLVSSY